LQQHILKQVVLVLWRGGAATNNFQHQAQMRVQPSAKDGFLFER
jgi:hypothetical protein